jgi:hypothetical protein
MRTLQKNNHTGTSKENYQQSTEAAIEFYTEEFNKMLKEHMKQYEVVFDKKSSTKKIFGFNLCDCSKCWSVAFESE